MDFYVLFSLKVGSISKTLRPLDLLAHKKERERKGMLCILYESLIPLRPFKCHQVFLLFLSFFPLAESFSFLGYYGRFI